MSCRPIRSCTLLLATILLMVTQFAWAFADPDVDSSGPGGDDYVREARFLFSFAKFTEWPNRKFTQPDSPLVIGIVGNDPFGDLITEAVADQRYNDRTVIVRHVEEVGEWRKCHILFISRSETGRLGYILNQVKGDNVLTVGESDKFISDGGIINFVMVGGGLKFEISNKAAKHASLKIDSRLLMLGVPSKQSP